MQVRSPSVSFMARETYAIESTTAFSAYLCWLPNFLRDRSLPLMTLLRLVNFCGLHFDVHLLVVLRPVGLWRTEIFVRGLCNSFRVCKQWSGVATGWSFPQEGCAHACVCVCEYYCLLNVSKKSPQLFMKMFAYQAA